MNILILEDNDDFIHRLKSSLNNGKIGKLNKHSFFCFHDHFEGIDYSIKYQLIFIDIHLGNENGILIAKTLKRQYPDAVLVFVTVNESLVFQTFEVQPFFFIRKKEFDDDFQMFEILFLKHYNDNYSTVLTLRGKDVYLKISEIIYVEIKGHQLLITTSHDVYTISKSIQEFKNKIQSHKIVQIHRSFLINLDYLYNTTNNTVILETGLELPIGRKYKEEFKKELKEYILNAGF